MVILECLAFTGGGVSGHIIHVIELVVVVNNVVLIIVSLINIFPSLSLAI